MKLSHWIRLILLILFPFILSSCKRDAPRMCDRPASGKKVNTLTRLAFGSCADQEAAQPILLKIIKHSPDVMMYLGDNIYGDTEDMGLLRAKYGELACKPEFQALLQSVPVIATWDDHDFGENDGGRFYPRKTESKKVFMEFWNESFLSDRWNHEGIYTSYYYGDSAHRVQIILLDCRTFRDNLKESADGYYLQNWDTSATMLGAAQWVWLENEFRKHARVRIIGSSTPFGTEYSGAETWGNMPLEQQKMFDLIKSTHAEGVIFTSGDIHYGELSKHTLSSQYPIYDLTSSGINRVNSGWNENEFRIGNVALVHNFGLIDIDWQPAVPQIYFRLMDEAGVVRLLYSVSLDELKF